MYVSPAVRSIRDDPVEKATDLGTVESELPFETLAVIVPHERVADVCDLDGVATVETANTLGIDLDGAGEDVRPGE